MIFGVNKKKITFKEFILYICFHVLGGILKSNNKKIKSNGMLFIKLDRVGDMVIWMDAAREYRRLFPECELTLVCDKLSSPIAKMSGHYDHVIEMDWVRHSKKGIDRLWTLISIGSLRKELIRIIREVRKNEYGKVIQVRYERCWPSDIIALFSKANEKITNDCDFAHVCSPRCAIANQIYDRIIPTPGLNVMYLRINAIMIRRLTHSKFKCRVPILPVEREGRFHIKEDYFVIYPGASGVERQWPISKFADVVKYIHKRTGWKCVICGSEEEIRLARLLSAKLNKEFLINTTGQTGIIDAINIIGNAKMVISNDTSGIHIAAATHVPSVCIRGMHQGSGFLPYEVEDINDEDAKYLPHMAICKVKCAGCYLVTRNMDPECAKRIRSGNSLKCIEDVTVETVISKVEKIFSSIYISEVESH